MYTASRIVFSFVIVVAVILGLYNATFGTVLDELQASEKRIIAACQVAAADVKSAINPLVNMSQGLPPGYTGPVPTPLKQAE